MPILTRENHTIKRSLKDQRFLGGIGNAYSDEILHHARISPMRQVKYLNDDGWNQLYLACQDSLEFFTTLLDESVPVTSKEQSPRSFLKWQFSANTGTHVRSVAIRSRESVMLTTIVTIAHTVRISIACSQTVGYHDC